MAGFAWEAGRDMNALSDQLDATATGVFGDFRPAAINFGGQSTTNWLLIGVAVAAVVYLLRK